MILENGSHIIPGTCPPYSIRPKGMECPFLNLTSTEEQPLRGEQPPAESPSTNDISPNDSEIPGFGCHGAYPPKHDVVSVDFEETTVDSGMAIVDSDAAASTMDGFEVAIG